MENKRENNWGQLAIPHGFRKEFDSLAAKLTFEDVDRELTTIEDIIGQFLGAIFQDATFNRSTIRDLYEYGFNGSLQMIKWGHSHAVDWFIESFIGVSDLNKHVEIHSDFDPPHALGVIAIVNAVAARTRLDRHRLKGTDEYLTIQEVALLARMTERSIRNAAAPSSSTPLKSDKIEGLTIIKAAEADRWLSGRRGYKPTEFPEDIEARKEIFSVLDSWVIV